MSKGTNIATWKLPQESMFFDQILNSVKSGMELVPADIEAYLVDKTSIPELINVLTHLINEDESLIDALEENIKAYKERKARMAKRVKTMRDAIQNVLTKYQIEKLECPNATISMVHNTKGKLNIVDEFDIIVNYPEYVIKPEPVLNKQKILEDLRSGREIRGAELLPTQTIAIRK